MLLCFHMKKNKFYELVCLISSELNEEELNSLSEKINSWIKQKGGTLEKENQVFKKKLAYPIKDKLIVYLKNIDFHLANEQLIELRKEIDSEKKILRYMILNKKIEKIKKEKPKKTITKEKPKKKVELKEIEEKLEEILQEPR